MEISGFENLPIENFSLKKSCGEHSTCEFVAFVKSEELGKYVAKVGEKIRVTVDNGRRSIFLGVVDSLELQKTFFRAGVKILARSLSCRLDEVPKCRIFQEPDKTFGDVLSVARLQLSDCALKLDEKFSKLKADDIILQNRETDFRFINRMASAKNFRTWIVDTKENLELRISHYLAESAAVRADEIVSFTLRRGQKKFFARLVLNNFIDIGRLIQVCGVGADSRKYLVVAEEVCQVNGVERFIYDLEEFKDEAIGDGGAVDVAAKFRAKVIDTNDPKHFGRIKVAFDKNDVEDNSTRQTWIPYRSPYSGKNGGIVFLPDVGDLVEVFFIGGECYCGSTLRENPLDAECRNVKEKFIGNNFKQRIIFREKSLDILSFDNKIILDEKKIELTVGENVLRLDEKGITLKNRQNEIALTAKGISELTEGALALQSKQSSSLKTDALTIVANGDAKLKAANFDIKGSEVKIGDKVKLG